MEEMGGSVMLFGGGEGEECFCLCWNEGQSLLFRIEKTRSLDFGRTSMFEPSKIQNQPVEAGQNLLWLSAWIQRIDGNLLRHTRQKW